MEKGVLRSRGAMFFCPEGKRVPVYARRFLQKAAAVVLPPSPWSPEWKQDWPEAWCCRNCKTLVIPYSDKMIF